MPKIIQLLFINLFLIVILNSCEQPSLNSSDEGALSGLFSVSETEQIHFSQGNLQYQASTNTWRFAENQFDIIGANNSNKLHAFNGMGKII